MVILFGCNGMGKMIMLCAFCGLELVKVGCICFLGEDIVGWWLDCIGCVGIFGVRRLLVFF